MKLRILVVDDEHQQTSMLRTVLEVHGHLVQTANSAAAARQLLTSSRFDFVITDMKMEHETAGYDVVRAAREHPNQPNVLILTAYPVLGDHWREAGASALLSKPLSIAVLLETLEKLTSTAASSNA